MDLIWTYYGLDMDLIYPNRADGMDKPAWKCHSDLR
jgi:hypothetical protein